MIYLLGVSRVGIRVTVGIVGCTRLQRNIDNQISALRYDDRWLYGPQQNIVPTTIRLI